MVQYKVVVVSESTSGCGNVKSIDTQIENEANKWSKNGYVLVTAYQQNVSGCGNQNSVGAVLIFAKQ